MSSAFTSEKIQSKPHGANLRKYLSWKVSKTTSTKDKQLQTVKLSTDASATDDVVSKLDTLKSLPESEKTSDDNLERTNQAATPKTRKKILSRNVSAAPVLAMKVSASAETVSTGSMGKSASGTNLSDLGAQHLIQRTRSNSCATSPFEWDASGRRIRKVNVAPLSSVGSGLSDRDRQVSTSFNGKPKPIFDWDSKGNRLGRQGFVSSTTSSRTRSDGIQGYSKKRVSVEILTGLYREKPSFVPVAVVKPKPKKVVPMISAPRIRNLA